MSEPMGMSITIGGELPASLIKEFLEIIDNDIAECTGPTTESGLRAAAGKDTIRWDGITNYGQCEEVENFCCAHNLSYSHHIESNSEYNADITYWVPEMKNPETLESNHGGDVVVDAARIRPLVDLLMALEKDGEKCLPLFLHNDTLKPAVTKGLKDPKKLRPALAKLITDLLPVEPELPPFTIKEDA